MKNGSSRGSKRDEFHSNIDSTGAVHLYPFPIEDANRTADQFDHKIVNQIESKNALLG